MFTAEKSTYEGYEIVKLSGAGHEAAILPVNGFNLYHWTYEGKEIFMQPADIHVFGTKYGNPILFPTPNRVKNATYTWAGETHVMKKRGQDVLIHGFVKDEPFTVTEMSADETCARCTGRIEIRKEGDIFEGWPWNCALEVTYILNQDGVHMDVRAENLDDTDMPFGFAVHPYFSKRGDANNCFIKVPVRRYYEADENMIPSGKLLDAGEGTTIFDDFHSVESLYLDTVFRGMNADSEAQIRYDDVIVHIYGSDCLRNAVVFTPHNRNGFCIEPQTCATNFINMHQSGLIDESGLLLLPAGKTFACAVHMTVTKR